MFRLGGIKVPLRGGIDRAYAKIIHNLLPRFFRSHTEQAWTADYLVWWLTDDVRPTVTAASWNVYKAAIVRYLAAVGADEAAYNLNEVDARGCLPRPKKAKHRTSGQKAKLVDEVALRQVRRYLMETGGKWDGVIGRWLEVGILTGLRPEEWRDAKLFLQEGEWRLKLRNAKYRAALTEDEEGRAHGEFRHLCLHGVSKEQQETIAAHIDNLADYVTNDEVWAHFYEKIRKRLSFVMRRAVRERHKRFTLYSLRHQFAANAKSAGLSLTEIACLMGHAVTRTAAVTYGRKRYGGYGESQAFPLRALADEMARVKVSKGDARASRQPSIAVEYRE